LYTVYYDVLGFIQIFVFIRPINMLFRATLLVVVCLLDFFIVVGVLFSHCTHIARTTGSMMLLFEVNNSHKHMTCWCPV
jgi:hypothetical protein